MESVQRYGTEARCRVKGARGEKMDGRGTE